MLINKVQLLCDLNKYQSSKTGNTFLSYCTGAVTWKRFELNEVNIMLNLILLKQEWCVSVVPNEKAHNVNK
jgi:hypothetical protein